MVLYMVKIKGFENYFIDENGNIYDRNKKIMKSKWVDNTGYYQIVLRKDNKRHHIRIHRLVALQFLPNPDNLPQVNHKDGNKLNNNVDNLEWVDNKTNTQHGYDNGCYHTKKRRISIKATHKITGEIIIFPSIRQCAKMLKLNRKTITSILYGDKTTNNYEYNFEIIK